MPDPRFPSWVLAHVKCGERYVRLIDRAKMGAAWEGGWLLPRWIVELDAERIHWQLIFAGDEAEARKVFAVEAERLRHG